MAGHVHAELIMQYALDAKTNEKPWELWEYKDHVDGNWQDFNKLNPPNWFDDIEYRRKPKTISINGFDVPTAEREAPQMNSEYFTVSIGVEDRFNRHIWCNDSYDRHWLKCGLIHLTKEAAIQHAKALLSFTERKE